MKIIFSPVGLFVVLTIYSSLGALIFQAIEGKHGGVKERRV
jgi:hypothetical protein